MDLLIDSTIGSAMFSFMDGFSEYNQIRMAPKDAEKTAFRTPMGNFYYTVMPFGLKNAGATYQMTVIFHDMMHQELEDYVDDIVVKSKRREEHFHMLKRAFERCRAFKLRMNPLKCAFRVSSGKFLGFLVHSRGVDVDPAKATAIATMRPPITVPIHKKPLLLYLATNSYAIGALIAQEDGGGVEQLVYYISRALKDAETHYPRVERACLAIQPILSGRISQWLLQLSQYDLRMGTPKVMKSQAIANLLAQFQGEEEFPLDDEVPGEVAVAEEFGGVGVVLYHEEDKVVVLSFKLEFPCSNNTAKYETYLTGLAMDLKMGVKHLRVLGDSNLVVCQAKGSFSLKEPSLTSYRAMAQRMEEKFSTFELEHAPRNENRFADALAALGSQIIFKGDSTGIEVSKREESIIEVLKERFWEEQGERDWRIPIREVLIKGKDAAELKILKNYALVREELYPRMLGGVLSKCMGQEEA
ncbi:uncharacterized protein LOC115951886 [Quercus lobata]|uniref:uncharacterized protein LOC115951886 n=1 Tax=Quercus lobata TaxID=97700 RepID=UPI001249213E|nr:uncharacterized protein LOC115951886 [Quercus lobata]